MTDYAKLDVLEEQILNAEGKVIGIEYHPDDNIPDHITELDGTILNLYDTQTEVKFLVLDYTVDEEEIIKELQNEPFIESVIRNPMEFTEDWKRKVKNRDRKMRRRT